MFKASEIEFSAGSDVVVVGCNPENADYDNPRGDIHGFAWYVVASNARGDTKVIDVGVDRWADGDNSVKAVRLSAALRARAAGGKLPVGFDGWADGRAVYGSEAYAEYGAADELAWEAAND